MWSFHNESIRGAVIASLFIGMILTGIVFALFNYGTKSFDFGDWGENSLSFALGFILWLFIAASPQNILSITQNSLFSSISTELPRFTEFILGSLVIPIAEEIFWMIGIPFAIIGTMNIIGKKYKIASNVWLQLLIITIITGVTFAIFHVGKYLILFLIAAFIFRTIMVWTVIADQEINWLKPLKLVPSFTVGAHIANNWSAFGLLNGFQILIENGIVGWLIIGFLVLIFISATVKLIGMFRR